MIGPVGNASPLEYNSTMITQADQQAIRTICRKYGVTRAFLFGSCLDATREGTLSM
jgi:predicted nucleotidyltransferase